MQSQLHGYPSNWLQKSRLSRVNNVSAIPACPNCENLQHNQPLHKTLHRGKNKSSQIKPRKSSANQSCTFRHQRIPLSHFRRNKRLKNHANKSFRNEHRTPIKLIHKASGYNFIFAITKKKNKSSPRNVQAASKLRAYLETVSVVSGRRALNSLLAAQLVRKTQGFSCLPRFFFKVSLSRHCPCHNRCPCHDKKGRSTTKKERVKKMEREKVRQRVEIVPDGVSFLHTRPSTMASRAMRTYIPASACRK